MLERIFFAPLDLYTHSHHKAVKLAAASVFLLFLVPVGVCILSSMLNDTWD